MAPEVKQCTPNTGLVFLLVLGFIPGVLCDNYTLSGLVASSIASVFFLIMLVVVLTMGIIWHRWFPRYQLARSKVKIPRHIRFAKLRGSRVEIIEPESRSLHLTSYPPSMRSTKLMVPTTTTYQKADSWIKQQGRYEEPAPKESVMNFGEEEGDVIVTEIGPEVETPKSRLTTTIQVDPDKNTNNNATDDEISRLNRRQSDLANTQGVFNFDDEETVLDTNIGNEGTVLY